MPVLRHPSEPTHAHGDTRFTSLATPSRGGARDTSVWRVDIAPGTYLAGGAPFTPPWAL